MGKDNESVLKRMAKAMDDEPERVWAQIDREEEAMRHPEIDEECDDDV